MGIDRLLFSYLYFQFPNELEWDTSPWYNFLHKIKQIKYSEDKGIVIAGSSVALFSALPTEIQDTLNTPDNKNFRVDFFSHVAMTPTDLYYYSNWLTKTGAKVVVYLFNPADLQFDHFLKETPELCPLELYIQNGEPQFSEEDRLRAYVNRVPTRVYYPFAFLLDNWKSLDRKDVFQLTTKSFLHINAYRTFLADPFDAYFERHLRSQRRYHNYTGVIPKEGIWRKGWTPESFSLICEKKEEQLDEMLFFQKPDMKIKIFNKEKILFDKVFHKAGWHRISFRLPSDRVLHFTVTPNISSKLVDPKEYGKEYFYGIRLSQNFCKTKLERNISYLRTEAIDEHRFEVMSKEEYGEDYHSRLYKDNCKRAETLRMNRIYVVKKALKDSQFKPFSEVRMIQKVALKLKQKGIRFIMINNPESPLELKHYREGRWYQGYLSFFHKLEQDGLIQFEDLSQFLTDERDFIDPHHLTLPAAHKMTIKYTNIIKNNYTKLLK
ncbi:MAG: hypothetical protein H7A25_20880 [Leptospiraceae bacterium]|nr:hypothetical protein [Leptospiraceae bacterium]